MNEPEAYCGIVTMEEPFSVKEDGIYWRGYRALKLGSAFFKSKAVFSICSLLNETYRKGYQEGQVVMAKPFKQPD